VASRGHCVPDPNRAPFELVVRLLRPVLDELVFVGGCTTGLFVTDSVSGDIRSTKDVDAIVDGRSEVVAEGGLCQQCRVTVS
jgi:hypothetical protein